jgi:nitrate/TMAO reductase-like tetraheme cytochrome c subunit
MDAKYQDSFKNRDPKSFESNFKAIERETCVQCHTQEQAGNDCLICHNYHIGEFAPALTSTPSADSSK